MSEDYDYDVELRRKYEKKGYMPHPDDIIWIDAKGNRHLIAEMPIEHVEACMRFLNKIGFRNEIPKAFYKRYAERHKLVMEEFDEL